MAESQEAVALELFKAIAYAEGKSFPPLGVSAANKADREWVLTTYAQCLEAVRQRKLVPIEEFKK